jgi:lipoprotein-releasing system permease protein
VVAARGQSFEDSEDVYRMLQEADGVLAVTRTIEGKIGLEYVDKQAFCVIKGVEENFPDVNPINGLNPEDSLPYVYQGSYTFERKNGRAQILLGSGVAARLHANYNDELQPINLMFIPPDESVLGAPTVRIEPVFPSGYFSIQKEYDEKYVLGDFAFVQEVFGFDNRISAYEIKLSDIGQADATKAVLAEKLGPAYEVQTWFEQHKTLYMVMRNEKYISYLILTLMLALAAVNIVGSLSMIVLEKTRDIAVLKSMGATMRTIRQVFLTEGLLVGGLGVLSGMTFAYVFGLLQIRYGLIQLQGGDSFRVKAFPLAMQWGDFLLIFATVMGLSILASLYPSFKAAQVKVVEGLRR